MDKLLHLDINKFNGTTPLEGPKEPFSTFELCEPFRITTEKNIPNPEPTITINGAAIASPGNLTGISAASKAGKTAAGGVVLAGGISKTGEIDGFKNLRVKPNPEGKAVIHLDTEQSAADQQYFIASTQKRAGLKCTPDYFLSYNNRQLKVDEYETITTNICRLAAEKFNGIHLILIDGGADYLTSVNDEEASNRIVQYFIHLAIEYNCPVIVIVHVNPGSEKERGHFGSEIQRKCYGLLSITKEGDISTLQAKIMRKAGNDDMPAISFAYDKEKGYHIEIDKPDNGDNKAIKERSRLEKVAMIVFAPPSSYCYKDAIAGIMNHTSRKISTAKSMLENMVFFHFIEKGNDGFYRMNMDKVNSGQNRPIDP